MSTTESYPSRSGASNFEPARPALLAPPETGALAKLKASRARLRGVLLNIAHPPAPPPLMSNGIGGLGERLFVRVRALPGVAVVMDGLQAWWRKSPAGKGLQLVEPTAVKTVAAVGRKNPQALLVTSAAVGALTVIAPWRWLLGRLVRTVLFSGVVFEVAKIALRRRP